MADPADAPLSAAQRSRIRRLSAPREAEPGDEAGELNVVPYLDIIMNILMFVLVTVCPGVVGTIRRVLCGCVSHKAPSSSPLLVSSRSDGQLARFPPADRAVVRILLVGPAKDQATAERSAHGAHFSTVSLRAYWVAGRHWSAASGRQV